MSSLTVTKRKVKNGATGIDMNVPSFVPADSPRNVKLFHVVVISNLPHFKSEKHSEEDTIQFMVQRDYDAFEKLQKELNQQFPDLKLPMPRKHFLFMSDEDLEDRRVSFDCFLTVVAKSKELCTSIPVLIFLGIDLLADRKYAKRRKDYLEKIKEEGKKNKASEVEAEDVVLFEDKNSTSNAEDDEDLFGSSPTGSQQTNLNGSETKPTTASVNVSLLNDDLEYKDALYLAEQSSNGTTTTATYQEDDELKKLSESIDDDLVVTTKQQKVKKGSLNNQSEEKKKIREMLFDEDDNKDTSIMNTNDVMDYLKRNTDNNDDDDDLSLF